MSETVGEWFDNPHPVDGWVPVGPVVYIPIPPEGQAMTTITPEAVDAAQAAVPYVRSGDLMTALTAALPHIEAAIADRLESWATEHKRSGNPEHDNALSMAASLIRGRVANWPGTGDPR
jgi:hypothetical protein